MWPNRRILSAEAREKLVALLTEDQMQAEATTAAAKGLHGVLKRWNMDRPIRSLNRQELEMMAVGAISEWTLCRARQEAAAKDDIVLANLLA